MPPEPPPGFGGAGTLSVEVEVRMTEGGGTGHCELYQNDSLLVGTFTFTHTDWQTHVFDPPVEVAAGDFFDVRLYRTESSDGVPRIAKATFTDLNQTSCNNGGSTCDPCVDPDCNGDCTEGDPCGCPGGPPGGDGDPCDPCDPTNPDCDCGTDTGPPCGVEDPRNAALAAVIAVQNQADALAGGAASDDEINELVLGPNGVLKATDAVNALDAAPAEVDEANADVIDAATAAADATPPATAELTALAEALQALAVTLQNWLTEDPPVGVGGGDDCCGGCECGDSVNCDPVPPQEDVTYWGVVFLTEDSWQGWTEADKVWFAGFTLEHQAEAGIAPQNDNIIECAGAYLTNGRLHGRWAAADGVPITSGAKHCVEVSVLVSSGAGHPITQTLWLDGVQVGSATTDAFPADPGGPTNWVVGAASENTPPNPNISFIVEGDQWQTIDQIGCDEDGGGGDDGGGDDPPEVVTVTITDPTNGETITESPLGIYVTATSSTGEPIESVTIRVDGTDIGDAIGGPDFVFWWDWFEQSIPPGTHVLTAVANDTVSAPVSINLADIEPPVVIFTSPAPGQGVAAPIDLAVDADDNVAVVRVDFFIDDVFYASAVAAPWRVPFDPSPYADGSYTAKATAYDSAGNSADATVTFEIGPLVLPPLETSNFVSLPPQMSIEIDFDTDAYVVAWEQAVLGTQPYGFYSDDDAGAVLVDGSGGGHSGAYLGDALTQDVAALIAASDGALRITDTSASGITYPMVSKPPRWTWATHVEVNDWGTMPVPLLNTGVGGIVLDAYDTGALVIEGVLATAGGVLDLGVAAQVAIVIDADADSLGTATSPAAPGPNSYAQILVNGNVMATKSPLSAADILKLLLVSILWKTGLGGDGDITVDETLTWQRAVTQGELQTALASAGSAGGPVTNVWTDVTPDVVGFTSKLDGRGNELDAVEVGDMTLGLKNPDRRYEPFYEGSPYFPNVDSGRPIRVRAFLTEEHLEDQIGEPVLEPGWYSLWTGTVEQWPPKWDAQRRSVIAITCKSGRGRIASADPISADYDRELTGARINRILDACGWTGPRVIDSGRLIVAKTAVEEQQPAQYADKVAGSEAGCFFTDADGAAVFHDRDHRATSLRSTVPRFVFGDGGDPSGEYPYTAISPDADEQRIFNEIIVTRPGDFQVAAADAYSIGRYGRKSRTFDTELASETASRQLATTILVDNHLPKMRITELQFVPHKNVALWKAAVTLAFSDRVIVIRRPPIDGVCSDPEQLSCYVEAVVQSVSLEQGAVVQWTTTLALAEPGEVGTIQLIGGLGGPGVPPPPT